MTLNKPSAGDTNWATPVNDNWTSLENSVSQSICEGRLTLSSTLPVPTSDVTAATSIYFLPYKGNRIAVYSGSVWSGYIIPASGGGSTSLSLSGLIANVTYDIFIYDNAGTLTLEALAWKKVVASNSPTSGSNKVINLSDTTGLSVGSLITVTGGGNNEIARVNAVTVNTSVTVDSLANSYTNPDIYFPVRATALAVQDGIYVKSGASTRRYLGTIRITGTTGQCEDSVVRRLVANYYNRVPRLLFICPGYSDGGSKSSYTQSGDWTQANSGTNCKIELVSTGEDATRLTVQAAMICLNNVEPYAGIGIDKNKYPVRCCWMVGNSSTGSVGATNVCMHTVVLDAGYHCADLVIACTTGTATYYADGARSGSVADPYLTYIEAEVMS